MSLSLPKPYIPLLHSFPKPIHCKTPSPLPSTHPYPHLAVAEPFASPSLSLFRSSPMADRNPNILQELDALSHTLYPSNAGRRTNSLALPRTATTPISNAVAPVIAPAASTHRPRSRRMSMSPFRSRPKSNEHPDEDDHDEDKLHPSTMTDAAPGEKKGIWGWKPLRALTHIGMQRLNCLFSVEVIEAMGLPASMNGLRLSVIVRKKETKEGAVQTLPSRVLQGSANFEETLFIRCHVYCSGGAGSGKPLKFEPRPFLVSALAIDAPELDFGRNTVDLTLLVKESMEKSFEGTRVKQWDASFPLAGKAKGGQLAIKLGFQIMEDGGVAIYNQAGSSSVKSSTKGRDESPSTRRQSKTSFSVTSPRVTRPEPTSTPAKTNSVIDLKGIDDFNLDEPGSPPSTSPVRVPNRRRSSGGGRRNSMNEEEDDDMPDFDVEEKGIEIQEGTVAGSEVGGAEAGDDAGTEAADEAASVSSEVVKEVVHDSAHLYRITELDAIAKQIKALESIMLGDSSSAKPEPEPEPTQQLDAEEENVTREFIQMLEQGGEDEPMSDALDLDLATETEGINSEAKCYISDLGKGLGSVVQTRDGGYLAAMNPLDVEVERKSTPKLAMQISKPLILQDMKPSSGFELFQTLAAMGPEELGSQLQSLTAMDELVGKTAEQIAFEGMAAAIISGRNKEGANSSAERTVAALKTMSAAMAEGRRERITTGIWNLKEEPVVMDEVLALSLQKIETMAVEALKVQAGVAEEEAPFDASPLTGSTENPLHSAVTFEEWEKNYTGEATLTLLLVIQMRDPLRRYEAVGAPAVVVVQAAMADEERFKVTSLHIGGMRLGLGGKRSDWDGEKQRLTAMQWLVAYGLAKARRRSRAAQAKAGKGLVWSLSSRVMADMWLKPMRNPDVKVSE